MGLSKEKVQKILAVIEHKWKQANADHSLHGKVRSQWILICCEYELQELMNMHVTPQWLNENGYEARVAVKKALAEYKIISWEQRWHSRT